MGGFSLTNPGLVTPDSEIDPTTGQPVVKPRVAFFPNNAARALAFAKQQQGAVQPTTSTVEGSIDGTPITGEIQPPTPPVPKFFKPSFTSTLTDPTTGLPAPINPAQTKLGKLVTILGSAARGALAGWGYGNAAQGAQAAREIPFQEASENASLAQQQAQTALTRSQASMVPTPYGPMPLGMARYIFPSLIRGQASRDVAQTKATSAQDVADTRAQSALEVAGVNKRYMTVPGVGLFDTQNRSLIPGTQQGITVTPEIAQDYNLPADFVGKPLQLSTFAQLERVAGQFTPTVSKESSTTDLMGNTNTTRTTQKLPPGGAPTATVPRTAGAAPSFIQTTAGGPLIRQGGTPGTSAARPQPTRPAAAASPATDPTMALPQDVETRLAGSGLNQQEQAYVRGLLTYRGQMPSPRARNYAQTLGTLTSIDPSFDATNYDAHRQTALQYTPGGAVGKQVLAFNTAIRHMGMLSDAADALRNGNVQLANKLVNAIKLQFGSSAPTNFDTIKTYLAGELAKGFGGGVATDSSRAEANTIMSKIQSPDQLGGGMQAAVDLLRGKINAQEEAYETQMHRPIQLIDKGSHAVLQKLGMEQAPANTTPSGKTQNGGKTSANTAARDQALGVVYQ